MARQVEFWIGDSTGFERIYGANWCAQSFTPVASHRITSVIVCLSRVGSPVGPYVVSIRNVDGSGHPTGGDLCSGQIDCIDCEFESGFQTIPLGAGAVLAKGTKYALVCRAPDAASDQYVRQYRDEFGEYANGEALWSTNSGVDWSGLDGDYLFEDWGNPFVKAGFAGVIG